MAMRASYDPDLVLVDEMLAPPPLEDARRSLEFWRSRKQALPLYKRSARREADAMIARWQERVRAAERARFASTPLGWVLGKLWPGRVMIDRRTVLGFAWKRHAARAEARRRLVRRAQPRDGRLRGRRARPDAERDRLARPQLETTRRDP